jgi:hypothetical protein
LTEDIANSGSGHFPIADGRALLLVQRIVALLNTVTFENARFDAGFFPVNLSQISFHVIVGDRRPWQIFADVGDVRRRQGTVHKIGCIERARLHVLKSPNLMDD